MACIAVGQFVALAAFFAAVLISALGTRSFQVTTLVEVLLYAVAVLALGLVARGLWRGRAGVRTAFLAFQIFGLPAAWQLWGSDQAGYRIAGVLLAVSCLVGAGLALLWAAGEGNPPPTVG